MAETAKKISMIPAKVQYDRNVKLSEKKMKVAAYCRVSTELEEQDSSYEAQVEYYTSKISENENWKNAGIYADDGKSGTNTKKRADFNAMIQDALAGKIDMILTKSVSRFARNTVDSLVTIRKLKEKNVAVVFEKEGINTLEGDVYKRQFIYCLQRNTIINWVQFCMLYFAWEQHLFLLSFSSKAEPRGPPDVLHFKKITKWRTFECQNGSGSESRIFIKMQLVSWNTPM